MALIEINDDLRQTTKFDSSEELLQLEFFKQFENTDTGEVITLLMREEKYLNGILIQEKEWIITDVEIDKVFSPEGVEFPLGLDSFLKL